MRVLTFDESFDCENLIENEDASVTLLDEDSEEVADIAEADLIDFIIIGDTSFRRE